MDADIEFADSLGIAVPVGRIGNPPVPERVVHQDQPAAADELSSSGRNFRSVPFRLQDGPAAGCETLCHYGALVARGDCEKMTSRYRWDRLFRTLTLGARLNSALIARSVMATILPPSETSTYQTGPLKPLPAACGTIDSLPLCISPGDPPWPAAASS